MDVKDRIRAIRKAAGLTQQEMADKLGISQSVIGNYESGRRQPVDAAVAHICATFGINVEWLHTGTGDMYAPDADAETQRIRDFVESAIGDRMDSGFKRRLVAALADLTEAEWTLLEQMAERLAGADDNAKQLIALSTEHIGDDDAGAV